MKQLSEDKLKEIKGGSIMRVSPFTNFLWVTTRRRKIHSNWRKIFGA